MHCKHCGSKIDKGSTFCSSCGKSIKKIAVKKEVSTSSENQKESTQKKKEIVRLGGLLIVYIIWLVMNILTSLWNASLVFSYDNENALVGGIGFLLFTGFTVFLLFAIFMRLKDTIFLAELYSVTAIILPSFIIRSLGGDHTVFDAYIVINIVWLFYLSRSHRVKNTFKIA